MKRLVTGVALMALTSGQAFAQQCVPDSSRRGTWPDPDAVTSRLGARADLADGDLRFWRDVRVRFPGTDSVQFVLRRATPRRRQTFDLIEQLYLGRGPRTYVGWRMGCGLMMDARGVPLLAMTFSRLEWTPHAFRDTTVLQGWQSDSIGPGYRLLLATRGRIVATSPRLYRRAYTRTLQDKTLIPNGTMVVAARESGGIGLVSLRTLQEVLPPTFRGVGGLAQVVDGKLVDQFLLTDVGMELHAYRTDGTRVPLPPFHTAVAEPRWATLWPSRFARVYAFADTIRNRCRLYDGRLEPVVPDDIATTREQGWRCAQPSPLLTGDTVQYLVLTDARGLTQSYRVSRTTIAPLGSDIIGTAVYVFRDGAMILKRTAPDGTTRYVTAGPTGTTFPGAEFTGFRYLGCGFVWVERDGKWYMPGSDGSISPELRMPFSC